MGRPGSRHDLLAVPTAEPATGKVLSRVRHTAGPTVRELRHPAPRLGQVLLPVRASCRHVPDRATAGGSARSIRDTGELHPETPRRDDPHLEGRPRGRGTMRYPPFGRTGMQVSVVGFGCWPMAGDRYGAIEDDQPSRHPSRAGPGHQLCGHRARLRGRLCLAGRRRQCLRVGGYVTGTGGSQTGRPPREGVQVTYPPDAVQNHFP